MRTVPWERLALIQRIRRDLWRYLTPAADIEQELLEASALLRIPPSELRTVGSLQFLVSSELGAMLVQLPRLLRSLATTTTHEEEISADRIRGSIQWSRTLGLRWATGIPHLYVTAPSRRAHQTPENELLVFLLAETISLGKRTGWHRSASEHVGSLIRERVAEAERLSQSRMLLEVDRRPVTTRSIARIRSGRYRRRYEPVLAAYRRYHELVGRLDRGAIRRAVETYGLVSRDDATLFELHCTFLVLDELRRVGWELERLGLFAGSLRLRGKRGNEQLEITYQSTPKQLSAGSTYRAVQRRHALKPGALRPDLVVRRDRGGMSDWLLFEIKGGERSVQKSARAAAYDLMAYRTAFSAALDRLEPPYGVGIAWGAELSPAEESEILLCTPDTLPQVIGRVLG